MIDMDAAPLDSLAWLHDTWGSLYACWTWLGLGLGLGLGSGLG